MTILQDLMKPAGTLCALLVLCGAATARGEERLLNLTIDDAVKLATERNHRIDTSSRTAMLAQEQVNIERSKRGPTLTISGMYSELNASPRITVPAYSFGPVPATDTDFRIGDRRPRDIRLTVTQPLFTGFEITSRNRIAEKERDIAQCGLVETRAAVTLDAKRRYFELLRVQRLKEMTFFAIKVLEDHNRVARELFEAGMVTKNDLLKSQVALSDGRYDDLRVDHMLSTTKLEFKKFLSVDEDLDIHVEDMLNYETTEIDVERSIEQAVRDRPEIALEKLAVESAAFDMSLQRGEYFPEVKLAGNVGSQKGLFGLEERYWDAGIYLTWNVWEGGITRHKVARSALKKKEAERRLSELTRDIRVEVRQAALKIVETKKRIDTMQETVSQAEENLRISEERYREQVTTSTEVLDALALLVKIRIQYYTSIYDFQIAKAEFERAISGAGFTCG